MSLRISILVLHKAFYCSLGVLAGIRVCVTQPEREWGERERGGVEGGLQSGGGGGGRKTITEKRTFITLAVTTKSHNYIDCSR